MQGVVPAELARCISFLIQDPETGRRSVGQCLLANSLLGASPLLSTFPSLSYHFKLSMFFICLSVYEKPLLLRTLSNPRYVR